MIRRTVILTPGAIEDLLALSVWIGEATSVRTAETYVSRIHRHLQSFDIASERGTLHADIAPRLRIVGFEGRLTIAFRVVGNEVQIVGVFRAGQDWAAILADR